MAYLELKHSPSRVGDIVGRVIRLIRLNYRWLLRFLILPSFLYSLCWQIPAWMLKVPGLSRVSPFYIATFAVCAVGLILCGWVLGLRRFAIISLSGDDVEDPKAAAREANSKAWLILAVFVPVLIADVALLACTGVLDVLIESAANDDDEMRAVVWLMLLLSTVLPYTWLSVGVCVLAAIVVHNKSSIWSGIKIFAGMLAKAPLLVFSSLFVFSLVYSVLQIPAFLSITTDEVPKIFTGTSATIVTILLNGAELAISAIFTAFWTAYEALAGASIYNEFRMRLEGQDIVRRLKEIETIASTE